MVARKATTAGPRSEERACAPVYTTGACAAAATKAAVTALLTGKPVDKVTIHLPIGQDADFTLHRCEWIEGVPGGFTSVSGKVLCSVIKDGGDDPDATHGAEICTTISLGPPTEEGVTIKGGGGVGTVTFPGTGIPVGEPAVTRVPRRMIIESALEAAKTNGLESGEGNHRGDIRAHRRRGGAEDH